MKTKTKRRLIPEKQCTHLYLDGRRCANWRKKGYETCINHIPNALRHTQTPGLMDGNLNRYKNGLRAAPLKPLRQKVDLQDHLTIKHYELFLAAETAAEEDNLKDLARLSTHLINTTHRFIKTLKK